jgi:hypothetical protein
VLILLVGAAGLILRKAARPARHTADAEVVLALGVRSTFFCPIKYAIMSQHFDGVCPAPWRHQA